MVELTDTGVEWRRGLGLAAEPDLAGADSTVVEAASMAVAATDK
jgi:hypothetical protein